LLRRTLNLGILAHVDAGKTTLTERLLYAAGVIDAIGSVDDGSTQTDFLPLEQQRGITIKSAVVSFAIDDVTVNLIDTPGHPDFIAEVERVLSVLDGAVLVISAVEGVQPQTRVLMRALQRLQVPTLIFLNKIDRRGADDERVLLEISERLTPAVVRSAAANDELAAALAERDDAILGAYVEGTTLSYSCLRAGLAAQTVRGVLHPVFVGSAITGAGVDALMAGIAELLPAAVGDVDGPVSGTVFKVERGPAGEKIAYVRMFSGTARVRDRVRIGPGEEEGKVTAISVFDRGSDERRPAVEAGQIGKLWGLGSVQIGDSIGVPRRPATGHHFAPPTLETAVVSRRPGEKGALHVALAQLAEQDPLINLRQDDVRQELFLSLYGEVQKEVIEETLASDFGLDVAFRETTTICVERPIDAGAAVELLGKGADPFLATVGLRLEPAPVGSGVEFRLDVKTESVPLYVYKSADEFRKAMEENVRETLCQGLYGWQVTDCIVTMTDSGYAAPSTGARDFRLLTPLVLMSALQEAGTVVCEPIHRFHLETPADTLGAILPLLARLGAVPGPPELRGAVCTIEGEIPAALVNRLQQLLRGPSRGEGVVEFAFDHYEPLHGTPPTRPRTDRNPLNREEYLLRLAGRVEPRRASA
jgi:ribosomal protection tetracycline resistance protein